LVTICFGFVITSIELYPFLLLFLMPIETELLTKLGSCFLEISQNHNKTSGKPIFILQIQINV